MQIVATKVGGHVKLIAQTSFEDVKSGLKDRVKAVGAKFDGKTGWIFPSAAAAAPFAAYASVDVRSMIEREVGAAGAAKTAAARLRAESVEASRATDADACIPMPVGIKLYPFQTAGVAYALKRRVALIGDEMGLGKTPQALAVINASGARSALIVVPAYLRPNWIREAKRFLVGGLSVEVARKSIPGADVVIVSYEGAAKLQAEIRARCWDIVICDEAHYLKNGKAARTKAILGDGRTRTQPLRGSLHTLYLSGTPLLNRPIELWPIIKAAGVWGDWESYVRKFCGGKITRFGWDVTGCTNPDQLQELLRGSIMVRRLKSQVLTELPAKQRQIVILDPESAEERAALKAEDKALGKRKAILAAAAQAGDVEAFDAAVRGLRAEAEEFQSVSKARADLGIAKIPQVLRHVDEVLDAEGAVIVFVHHRAVASALAAHYGEDCRLVMGGMTDEARQAAVDDFQQGRARVFLGTIDGASTGLTLTRARIVVFAEGTWTPGQLAQAEDRAHRIGQSREVLVQYLVHDRSLDAYMLQMVADKAGVLAAVLDSGVDVEAAKLRAEADLVAAQVETVAALECVRAPALDWRAEQERVRAEIEARIRRERAQAMAANTQPTSGQHAQAFALAEQRMCEAKAKHEAEQRERICASAAEHHGGIVRMRRIAEAMTEEQRDLVHDAVKTVSLRCDGANALDGMGYSKVDAIPGRYLALVDRLHGDDAAQALVLANRYQGQLEGHMRNGIRAIMRG